MNKEEMTYSKAIVELQQIVQEMEGELIDVDNLSDKVKRAAELIHWCRNKLRSTENELDSIFPK